MVPQPVSDKGMYIRTMHKDATPGFKIKNQMSTIHAIQSRITCITMSYSGLYKKYNETKYLLHNHDIVYKSTSRPSTSMLGAVRSGFG